MDADRKSWNEGQREFRQVLLSFEDHERAIALFLRQHAMLHVAAIVHSDVAEGSDAFSFADEVLESMTAGQMRRIPSNEDHSVAWCFWHMARIEDVTMNMLLAGKPQIMIEDGWLERLGVTVRNTGNVTDAEDIGDLNAAINLEALLAYRTAVGRGTRANVRALRPEELQQEVDPQRLQRVLDEGAVVKEAQDLIDYWGRKTIAELLLMPPTRHNMVHLNEAARIKKRRS